MASPPRNPPSIAIDGDLVDMSKNPLAASIPPHRTTTMVTPRVTTTQFNSSDEFNHKAAVGPAGGSGDDATPTGLSLQKQTTVGQTQAGLGANGALDNLDGTDRTSSLRHKAKCESVLHRSSVLSLSSAVRTDKEQARQLPVQDRLTDYLLYNAAEDVENKWNSQSNGHRSLSSCMAFHSFSSQVLRPRGTRVFLCLQVLLTIDGG